MSSRNALAASLLFVLVGSTVVAFAQTVCPAGTLATGGRCVATTSVYRWVATSAGTPVPPGVVTGGWENDGPLYVCRASYAGLQPGKVVGGNCNFGYGGAEISVSSYEILVGPPPHWVAASGGTVPSGAFAGGSEPSRTLYVCRAAYGGGIHPGKIVGGTCNIGWGGAEITLPSYEVMVP